MLDIAETIICFNNIFICHLSAFFADINVILVLDIDLDLNIAAKGNGHSRIKVRCSTLELTDSRTIAIGEASTATDCIKNSTVAHIGQYVDDATAAISPQQDASRYLVTVLAKLDLFINLVDEAVKVRSGYTAVFCLF